ncbi:MAG TPA: hypothetical protein VIK25_10230 [Gemmatimonadaceae bacterium]
MKIIPAFTLAATLAAPLAAQGGNGSTEFPRSMVAGIALHYGSPQGDFASNVNGAFGANGFFGLRLGNLPVALRADLSYSIYGSESRRFPLGGGPLGLISTDVNTTNNILSGGIGLQAGLPGITVRPYVGGSVGFSNFFTMSSVSGSQMMSGESFASTTNYSDGTFAKTLYGGFYIPIGSSGGQLDLGARYHWNGEARYLTDRDISFDSGNNPVLSPRRTRADLLNIQVGFAFGRR